MNHILVMSGLKPIHRKLKNLGVKLTLIIEANHIEERFVNFYDRIIGVQSTASIDEWIDLASKVHDIEPFTNVVNYNETNQEKAAAICSKLNIPYHSMKTIENVYNKYKMRQILKNEGIDSTESKIVKTFDEIKNFAETNNYPIVLKPLNGTASRGVTIIYNEQEIKSALEWLSNTSPNCSMYVEQYIDGDEYSVEAFSENGCHKVIGITKKFKDINHCVEVGHYFPAKLKQIEEEKIHEFIYKVLDVLEIYNGPSHTEIMVTNAGPKIIETHIRLGGDYIFELVKLSSGIDLLELCAKQAMGEKVMKSIPETIINSRFAAIWYKTPNAVGTLEKIECIEKAESAENVSRVGILNQPGTKLSNLIDSYSRIAYVIAVGDTGEKAITAVQNAANMLKFTVSC